MHRPHLPGRAWTVNPWAGAQATPWLFWGGSCGERPFLSIGGLAQPGHLPQH